MKINKSLLIVCIVETIIIICLAVYLIFYKSKPIKIPQEPQVIELVRDSIIRDSIYINNEVIKLIKEYLDIRKSIEILIDESRGDTLKNLNVLKKYNIDFDKNSRPMTINKLKIIGANLGK